MNIHESILIEQMRYLHRNVPIYVFTNLFATSVMAIIYWDNAKPIYLIGWVLAAAMITVWRLYLWQKFRHKTFSLELAKRWLRLMFGGPASAGIVWGMAAFLIVPELSVFQQFLFLCAMVFYAVSGMFNYSAYFPSYLCVFLPFGISAVVAVALGKTTFHPAFSGVLFLFVLSVTLVARRFNHMFIESLKLRFENIDLIKQLTVQKEAAETANLAKSRFLAAASHDLRQPMHAITLYLGTLAGFDLHSGAREMVNKVRQCAQTMDEMFRALLDMSRLDAAVVQPEMRTFPIALVLDHIRTQFEPSARAKNLALCVRGSSACVRSDVEMVKRILRNLVANAIRYTQHGRVLIGCRRKGEVLRLAVYDTGLGIPIEKRELVFEEFYQIHNPERDRSKGLGLGLAIVKRLAKLLSCRIALASNIDRGSMFAIDLPLAYAPQPPSLMRPVTFPSAAKDDLVGKLLVVIDDEEPILDATRSLLEQWGCTVVTAVSGDDAVQRLVKETAIPDAIICDYRLRGDENGIKAVTALRNEFNEDIPALLITGDTGPERIREIQESHFPLLHKPIEENALKSALLDLLQHSAGQACEAQS